MTIAPYAIWISGGLYLAAAIEFAVRAHWIDSFIWTAYASANVGFGLKAYLTH